MAAVKTLSVLGEAVEIYVDGEISGGNTTILVQISAPGGGPPPHMHKNEDETFCVLDGIYEFYESGAWRAATVGEPVFGPRGVVHAFRNVGSATGRMLVAASPSGLENFFEELNGLSPGGDMPRILEIFAKYGISLA